MEHHERALELETRRFSGMHLAGKPVNNQPFFGYSMDELKAAEGILLTSCPFIFCILQSFHRHFDLNEFISFYRSIHSAIHRPVHSSVRCSELWLHK